MSPLLRIHDLGHIHFSGVNSYFFFCNFSKWNHVILDDRDVLMTTSPAAHWLLLENHPFVFYQSTLYKALSMKSSSPHHHRLVQMFKHLCFSWGTLWRGCETLGALGLADRHRAGGVVESIGDSQARFLPELRVSEHTESWASFLMLLPAQCHHHAFPTMMGVLPTNQHSEQCPLSFF